MSKLTIYTKYLCPYCVQVKNQLSDMNIEFEEINIEDDAEQKAWIIEQGHKTMPQIYRDGKLFVEGGASGLAKLNLFEVKERMNGYDLGDLRL